MAAPKIQYVRGNYVDATMINKGSTDIAAGDPVSLTTGGIQAVQSDGDEIFAIAVDDIVKTSGVGVVKIPCGMVVKGTTTGDLALGGEVDIVAATSLFKAVAGSTPCGRVIDNDPASGGVASVFMYGFRED